jgi:excisionase family DNA binding protein
MTDFDPVEWITTQHAAALTGYTTARFRQLAKEGAISARKWGRDWFLSKAAVLAYYQEMRKLGPEKHNPWREDLEEQGRGRRQEKADGAE